MLKGSTTSGPQSFSGDHGLADGGPEEGLPGAREGLDHTGVYLRFDDRQFHVDMLRLTGRKITIYGQQEVVKDLIAARLRSETVNAGRRAANLEAVGEVARQLATQSDPRAVGFAVCSAALEATHADGGMRDALSVLDQCLSFGEGAVTADRVREVLGLVNDELYAEVLQLVVERRPAQVFGLVDRLMDAGVDLAEFMAGAAEMLRGLLMLQVGARPSRRTTGAEYLRRRLAADQVPQRRRRPLRASRAPRRDRRTPRRSASVRRSARRHECR